MVMASRVLGGKSSANLTAARGELAARWNGDHLPSTSFYVTLHFDFLQRVHSIGFVHISGSPVVFCLRGRFVQMI